VSPARARSRSAGSVWTQPEDVLAKLRRLWNSGDLLRAHARGDEWQPVSVPLRGPTATELGHRLGEAQEWVARWRAAYPRHLRLEMRTVGGRVIGGNQLPCRVWVDTRESMWALLGVNADVKRYEGLLAATRERLSALVPWVQDHPLRVLDQSVVWVRAIEVVRWLQAYDGAPLYLRQVDAQGVDTKFLETNRSLLGDLLNHVLPPERIDLSKPRGDLEGRFGFRSKPELVRLRTLDPVCALPGGFTELTVRLGELSMLIPPARRFLVVENETTFLALPDLPETVAILGGGYGLGRLARLAWLSEVELLYWGDLDTHGFAILDGLRSHFAHVVSVLMDRQTLLVHQAHWGHEPTPTRAVLQHLTAEEGELYSDLLASAFGPNIRLEQERIRFGWVKRVLADLVQVDTQRAARSTPRLLAPLDS